MSYANRTPEAYFQATVRVTDAAGAQSDQELVAAKSSGRIVVTRVTTYVDGSTTNPCNIIVGFGSSAVPSPSTTANDGIVLDAIGHGQGTATTIGNGVNPIAVGAKDEDLRYTCEDPAGGNLSITVFGYHLDASTE